VQQGEQLVEALTMVGQRALRLLDFLHELFDSLVIFPVREYPGLI
jgi:hypothetical protein